MAEFIQGLFGGSKPAASVVPSGGSDFADFAGAADPSPASLTAVASQAIAGAGATHTAAPYTKWYNVHERHSLSDFKNEGYILIAVAIAVIFHLWGSRVNREKAKAWAKINTPVLEQEFALVGFNDPDKPVQAIKEKSLTQFSTYASGRQNIAFLDVNLTLLKRYNPLALFADAAMGFFFESLETPMEKMEATLYPFDGREAMTVGGLPGAVELKKDKSAYDNFVWAIVNKDYMKVLRDERFDVSITTTKDHPKLPNWCTVMSESAEVTDLLLTPELIEAVKEAGELLQSLIVTDQPTVKPTTINETTPKKRIYLTTKFTTTTATQSLFNYFIRLPDLLVASAHFRPEVNRKMNATRQETIKRIERAAEAEKEEERNLEREKAKKLKRDLELKGLDAKAQKKYLEKEREKEQRKLQKKQTTRG